MLARRHCQRVVLAGAPEHEVLVQVVGVHMGVEAGQVELPLVAGPPLDADVAADPLAGLPEQGRADQRGDDHAGPGRDARDRAGGDALGAGGRDVQGLVPQHFHAIAANLALVVHAADQDAEGLVRVVPGQQG